jgi:hypothetical protein
VVSTFDAASYLKVRAVWRELHDRFGLATLQEGLVPHFSWHIAADYDLAGLEHKLMEISAQIAPFDIHTNGLGVFTGENPVLYLAIVKNAALMKLHRTIWRACEPFAQGSSPFYTEQAWIPHVTLASADLQQENLPDVLRSLVERDFAWTMHVESICVGRNTLGQVGELDCKFDLEGKPDDNHS